ncbi:MAG: T9SS type A sorting domain-containing protein, partial [Chlorobi bacterium]|nr:T9SS type A sorting domain-containing protein [Chlorobiota bacterium]
GKTWTDTNGPGLTNARINYIALDERNATRVYAATLGGSIYVSSIITSVTPANTPDDPAIRLHNYPDPFRVQTTISLQLNAPSTVTLTLLDIMGKPVSTLWNGSLEKGSHSFPFSKNGLPGGVYLILLETNSTRIIRKCLLVK